MVIKANFKYFNCQTSGKVSDVYQAAWQLGLKTTYYLRSLSITQIDKTVEINTQTKAEEPIESFTTKDAVASAIDKSTCEVCQ